MKKNSYSVSELADMKLPHLPTSRKGWLDLVKRENWECVMAPGGRGSKGGLRKEYYPSEAVAFLIQSALNHSENYPVAQPDSGHAITSMRVNDFASMPKYQIDTLIQSDQVVDYLAFRKDWLEMTFNMYNSCLALIKVKGDSMEPTLKSDDLVLTELVNGRIEDDSIYVLKLNDDLVVKRIQRKLNGSLLVKSDNPKYEPELVDESSASKLPVVGRVIWFGRRI